MSLSIADVEHIAELAKLALTPDEIEHYRQQLSDILEHFETLKQVDTSTVPPTASVLPLRTVMREDAVRPSLPTEDALANAPDQADGYLSGSGGVWRRVGTPPPAPPLGGEGVAGGRSRQVADQCRSFGVLNDRPGEIEPIR